MFLDDAHRWIRQDKLTVSKAGPTSETGVNDPSGATPDLGRILLDLKINAAVAQMKVLVTSK